MCFHYSVSDGKILYLRVLLRTCKRLLERIQWGCDCWSVSRFCLYYHCSWYVVLCVSSILPYVTFSPSCGVIQLSFLCYLKIQTHHVSHNVSYQLQLIQTGLHSGCPPQWHEHSCSNETWMLQVCVGWTLCLVLTLSLKCCHFSKFTRTTSIAVLWTQGKISESISRPF